jgi:ABC-type sulfate transport system permease component
MEPIISPWLIYLLGFIENLIITFTGGVIILGLGLIILVFFKVLGTMDDDEDLLNVVNKFRWAKWLFGIFLFLAIITPSRNTIIGMMVAQQITPKNIESAIKTGKDFKNEIKKDVIDIIQSVTKEKPQEKE